MISSTFLSDISEAQSLLRTDTMAGRAAWVKNSIGTNLLFFDRLYIGATDLLCNTLLHEAVLKDEEVAHRLLTAEGKRGSLLHVVAWDEAPFELIAERLLRDKTITPARRALMKRAMWLDRFTTSKTQTASVDFRDQYAERLSRGLHHVLARPAAERGLTEQTATHARRWLRRLEKLRAEPEMHNKISQSLLWRDMSQSVKSPSARTALKRLSDLAHQATMSCGIDAALSLNDVRESTFMHGVLMPDFVRSLPDESRTVDVEEAATLSTGMSASFPIETVQHLSLRQILALRTQGSFPDVRKRMLRISQRDDTAFARLQADMEDCAEPIRALTGSSRAMSKMAWARLQADRRAYVSFATREAVYAPAVAGAISLSGSISPVAAVVSGMFFALCIVRFNAARPKSVKASLFRTASAVAKETGLTA